MAVDENILKELEAFYSRVSLPDEVRMTSGSVIIDVPKFIETQFSYARAEGNTPVKKLAFERLQLLRNRLEGQND